MKIYFYNKFDDKSKKREKEERKLLLHSLNDYKEKLGSFYKEVINLNHIKISNNGKLFLESDDISFSISHSKNMWLCAVDHRDVGIDIEFWKDKNIDELRKLAKRFFHIDEFKLIEKYEREMFFKVWTIKEAIVKHDGSRLSSRLSKKEIYEKEEADLNDEIKREEIYLKNYYFKEINISDKVNSKEKFTAVVVSKLPIEEIEIIEIK